MNGSKILGVSEYMYECREEEERSGWPSRKLDARSISTDDSTSAGSLNLPFLY